MFRKSSKQKKHNDKRKRYTKKNNKTIRGAGLPGVFKWLRSNITRDTLFGKSIYTIRKENFIATPNINTFYNIITELYQVYFSLSKVEKNSTKIIVEQCWKLINKVFQHNEDPVIQKIINNTGINKTEFEHVLHLIQEEYNNNKTDYSPESVSNLIDDQVNKPSSGSTTSTTTSTTISPTSSTTSSTTSSPTQPMPPDNVLKSISNMLLPTKQLIPHKYMKYFQDIKYIPYEFENKLKYVGRGVYGKVFKAIQKKTGETYALKSILNATQEHMEEIKNELKILEAVEQNCKKRDDGTMGFIVCFTGITFNNEKIYIVNEFLTDYIELFDFVYKKKRGDITDIKALPVIIDKICRGLLSIHELGVAHRDIKLENIMINTNSKNPDFMNIKYIDFGFSTKVDSDGNYDVGRRLDNYTPLGTPLYLDPLYKKAINNSHLNIDILKNSDYYAIGIVIFELISSFMEIDHKYKDDSTPLNILGIDLEYFLVGHESTILSYNRGLNDNPLLTKIINASTKIGKTAKTAKLYYPDIIKLISLIPNRKEGIIHPQ
jgi:hypothetical protein